jgi:hypothetical protein
MSPEWVTALTHTNSFPYRKMHNPNWHHSSGGDQTALPGAYGVRKKERRQSVRK